MQVVSDRLDYMFHGSGSFGRDLFCHNSLIVNISLQDHWFCNSTIETAHAFYKIKIKNPD